MHKDSQPRELLGIFDSGVGGFSVYKKIREVTNANVVYYGDCARAPYGNREDDEIVQLVKDDIMFLQDENVKYFVNACNSMSVMTTDALLQECNVKADYYTDMIRALDKHASFEKNEKILVLGTVATIRSGIYQEVLKSKGVISYVYAYTELAGAIESNAPRDQLIRILEKGISYAKDEGVTSVIYGCTHYPLIHELFIEVQNILGWKGEFVDPAMYVAEEVKTWGLVGEKKLYPYSSKDTPAFINSIIKLL